MEELLHRLEKRLKDLLDRHEKLNETNQTLSEGKVLLAREKDILSAKQQRVIEQVRALLTRLKASENLL